MFTSDAPLGVNKLLLIGWDAADWTFIDPLLAQGKLPHLACILKNGTRADLATLDPKLSPLLWTTIATGKTADKHGILNFVEADPTANQANASGLRLASSTSRRTKALWNILTQQGKRVNVVSWYASHPAEPISGLCVSNQFAIGHAAKDRAWAMPAGAVHPADQHSAVAALRVDQSSIDAAQLKSFVGQLQSCTSTEQRKLVSALATHLAQARSVHAASLHALRRGPWDCTMVFHDMIDAMGHHFMSFAPPRLKQVPLENFNHFSGVMQAVYCEQDRMLGELMDAAGPNTTVVLLSDHGFYNDHLRPYMQGAAMSDERLEIEAKWHRALGILAMSGPGIRQGAVIGPTNLLDIAPTVLALLGISSARDMDGRALMEALEVAKALDPIPSWDDVSGEAGMHAADLRQDPFEAHAAIEQLIDLGYMQAMPKDAAQRVAHVKQECNYNLAVVYYSTNRAEQALALFRQLVDEQPNNTRYVMNFGNCLFATGHYQECEQLARRSLLSKPQDQGYQLMLAAALTHAGQMQEAAEESDRIKPDDDGWSGLGDLCVMQQRADVAERCFKQALQFNAKDVRAHVGLAKVALLRNQYETCATHCLDASDIDRLSPWSHYVLGVALAWYGDLENAARSFMVATTIAPRSWLVWRYLELVQRANGQEQVAQESAKRAQNLRAATQEKPDLLGVLPKPPEEWARFKNA
jgi:predicted AlkP superfamily phosphohydrolase/phosphomutase/tetratricopeptide (TPR) repeat protein